MWLEEAIPWKKLCKSEGWNGNEMVIHREGKYVVVELEKLGVDTENSDRPIFWGDLCIYFIDF